MWQSTKLKRKRCNNGYKRDGYKVRANDRQGKRYRRGRSFLFEHFSYNDKEQARRFYSKYEGGAIMNIDKRYKGFEVTYVPATNTKPSKVRIKDLRMKKTKIISYDYEMDDIEDMAKKYLDSRLGIEIVAVVLCERGNILLTDNFYSELM